MSTKSIIIFRIGLYFPAFPVTATSFNVLLAFSSSSGSGFKQARHKPLSMIPFMFSLVCIISFVSASEVIKVGRLELFAFLDGAGGGAPQWGGWPQAFPPNHFGTTDVKDVY